MGKEALVEELKAIKKLAKKDIKKNHPGYENCVIKDVIHYNKNVELVKRKSGKIEKFDLCVVLAEDQETGETWEMYYLNGEEVDFVELMRKYESPDPIKDVIDKTEENENKPKKEKDKEYQKDRLEELEEKEQNKEEKQVKKEKAHKTEQEKHLTGKKLKHAIQTIDVDKAYIDNWTTVRKGFGLPVGVEQIAIATPIQNDGKALSSGMTMYMLDNNGNIIQDINGKTIRNFFKIDRATGNNPINDENTKLELDGYVERNESQTMRRFKSIQNPSLYLSVEQKRVGEYVEVYAGRKTKDGNDSVEVQLETRNVGIQTSLEMQKMLSKYKGIYNIDDIDNEVDKHAEHGDDMKKIAIENADGDENTVAICESRYIPGTEKTWEELSEETGEGITKLQERFERELANGKEPEEIVDEIEYDYEMVEHNKDRV